MELQHGVIKYINKVMSNKNKTHGEGLGLWQRNEAITLNIHNAYCNARIQILTLSNFLQMYPHRSWILFGCLGPSHPHGRPKGRFLLFASCRLALAIMSIWRVKLPMENRWSLSLTFRLSKQTKEKPQKMSALI